MTRFARPSLVRPNRGFTLVEMLVVITLIGILVGLTMPAMNRARESARKNSCANNLRQLGLATTAHIATHGIFPTGGWGYRWLGDPGGQTSAGQNVGGFRRNQPGGWVYNLLPFLDQAALHDMGGGKLEPERAFAAATLVQTPLPVMTCPSLRRATTYPMDTTGTNAPLNIDTSNWNGRGAKSDYAINAGSQNLNIFAGPSNLSQGITWGEPGITSGSGWRQVNNPSNAYYCSGVSFERSEVTPDEVRDGLSMTLLIGEKFVDLDNRNGDPQSSYSTGNSMSMYAGYGRDNYRVTYNRAQPKGNNVAAPFPGPNSQLRADSFTRAPVHITGVSDFLSTSRGQRDAAFYYSIFGSIHPDSCNFVFCDGAVHALSYAIDQRIFACMGHRSDGIAYDMAVMDGASGEWVWDIWWSKQ